MHDTRMQLTDAIGRAHDIRAMPLLAMWLFAETPDLFTWIGAAVIFGAGLYIAHRERLAARR